VQQPNFSVKNQLEAEIFLAYCSLALCIGHKHSQNMHIQYGESHVTMTAHQNF